MLRELWKSVSVESGAQSVMKAGIVMMQQWCASSWDSREQVTCIMLLPSVTAAAVAAHVLTLLVHYFNQEHVLLK